MAVFASEINLNALLAVFVGVLRTVESSVPVLVLFTNSAVRY